MKLFYKAAAIGMVCMLGTSVLPMHVQANSEEPVAVIYHTGDTSGALVASDITIGAEVVSAIFHETREEIPATFLLDTGDSLQGNFFVNTTQGENAVGIMNAAGYDAMTLGNHEFDYGFDRLLELADMADFPFLTQRFVSSAAPPLTSHVIIERGGINIGIFGLTTPSAKYTSSGGFDENFGTVSDLIDEAVAQARALREEGADIVICLSHMGVSEKQARDYGSAYDIAENALGIDLIIDGHTPDTDVAMQQSYATPISSVGDDGTEIGKITFYRRDGVLVPEITKIIKEETAVYTPDPVVSAVINEWQEKSEEIAETVVGYSDVTLDDYEKSIIRAKESVLGDLVADAMRWASGADIAFCNAGNVRAPIEQGEITLEEIENVLPYANNVMVADVPGRVIKEALERSASLYGKQDGGFIQVSGLSYAFDPAKPEGSRLGEVLVGEEALVDEQDYSLAIYDFLADGGDGYTMLVPYYHNARPVEGGNISNIFAQYLSEMETIQASLQGRIIIKTEQSTQGSITGWLIGVLAAVVLGTAVIYLLLRKTGRLSRNERKDQQE
jgi:5'-nucleotidase